MRFPLLLPGVALVASMATVPISAVASDLALRQEPSARVVLNLSRREISVVRGVRSLGPWPVAIGDPTTPTPEGEFAILTKKINPVYVTQKGGKRRELVGPSSPIGDRYLAFHRNGRGEFGIHGTPWPHWVKTRAAVSLGCVRMLNEHVRQLFEAVDVGTTVEIRS